ncbi:excalibur calcium-binding domain-containing protein [Dactylosporangium sp. CS-047395]|uniref:excalibur calcium-binding domain-containing protein n=1 Tax=Dactylosporangium sp. CS-047395 TaxID=3239936 RepID=UPI003D8A341B
MAIHYAQPAKSRRPLLLGIGGGLAGLCVLCSLIAYLVPKDDKREPQHEQQPVVPVAVTPTATALPATTTAAATQAAVTTPSAVVITTTAAAPPPPPPPPKTTKAAPPPPAETEDNDVYYKNCTEAKKAGAAPLYRGEPGYRSALDRDGDGVACET